MQLFFQDHITSPTTFLTEEESKHLVRVLRKKQGDQIHLTDGKGSLYTCMVTNADPKKASLTILSTQQAAEDPFHLHLAIAPTKSPDRMEWMVEKITEIGFHELPQNRPPPKENHFSLQAKHQVAYPNGTPHP
jgi:16S rRNA (uracil1498-N3)-methyltransferase